MRAHSLENFVSQQVENVSKVSDDPIPSLSNEELYMSVHSISSFNINAYSSGRSENNGNVSFPTHDAEPSGTIVKSLIQNYSTYFDMDLRMNFNA